MEIYNYAVFKDLEKADFVALLNRDGNPLIVCRDRYPGRPSV